MGDYGIGTEVLFFIYEESGNIRSFDDALKKTDVKFHRGKVVDEWEGNEDFSYHGSPMYEKFTTIEDEQGNIYHHGSYSRNKIDFCSVEEAKCTYKYDKKGLKKKIRETYKMMNALDANALKLNLVSEKDLSQKSIHSNIERISTKKSVQRKVSKKDGITR